MKSSLGGKATIEEIFQGSCPCLLMLGVSLAIVMAFPILSTWLPSLM